MASDGFLTVNQPPGSPAAPSAGGASPASESSLAPDRNRTPVDGDRSAAAEEVSKAFSENTPSQDAAPTTLSADSPVSAAADNVRASAGPNSRGKQSSNSSKKKPSPRLQTGSEQSDWETNHNPTTLDASNSFSWPSDILSRPSMFTASPEEYEPPRGPLRVVNKSPSFDTQSLSESSTSPTGLPPVDDQTRSDHIQTASASTPTTSHGASSDAVTREDFNAFKKLVNKDLSVLTKQLLQSYKEGWENLRKKDAKIHDLERHIEVLRVALERSAEPSSQQPSKGTQQEPKTRTFEEAHASSSRVQSHGTTLPEGLRRLAIELILLRADVAKEGKDWDAVERHGLHAAKLAELLHNRRFSAWCEFYKGIAFFGQGKWSVAEQAFENARPCFGTHVPFSTADKWVRKLKAVQNTPFRAKFTPSITKVTPIDQSLFKGFEKMNNTPSWVGTPARAVPPSPLVPLIRPPLSPATFKSRVRAGQRMTRVPRVLGSVTDSIGSGPSLRRISQVLQESANQAVGGDNPLSAGMSAVAFSSDIVSPRKMRRGSRFTTQSTIAEEETDRESPSPAPLRPVTRRFSLDTDSSPRPTHPDISGMSTDSKHSSGRDHPQRSNSLSMNFKPGSNPSEPHLLRSSPSSQKLVPTTKPLGRIFSASSNRLISPSQPHEGPIQYASALVLPSDSSPGLLILPLDGGPTQTAIAFPYSRRRNISLDTSYTGSSLTSPQVIPPDLEDNRLEFSVIPFLKSPLQLSMFPSQNEPTKDEDGDRKTSIEEAGHMDKDAANKETRSGEETQPENPLRYGIKKSRKDSDFDSLYDLSTSGSGSGSPNGVSAGDEGLDSADDKGGDSAGDKGGDSAGDKGGDSAGDKEGDAGDERTNR